MPETWWSYVQRISGRAPQKDIAAKASIDPSRLTGWKNGDIPHGKNVVAFARGYGRPPVEALIAAGYLDPAEADEAIEVRQDAAELTDELLIAELADRLATRKLLNKPEVPHDVDRRFRKGMGIEEGHHGEQKG